MNLLAANILNAGPLANQPLLDSIRKTLTTQPDAGETLQLLTGMVAFLLLILLAARWFGHERRPTGESQVDYLTLAVDVLGLTERDRRELQKIARQAKLEQPAAMLLSPANLAHAAASVLKTDNHGEFRRRIEDLCTRLFDAPLPDPDRLPPEQP